MPDYLNLDYEDYLHAIKAIHNLPLSRKTTCISCDKSFGFLTMHVYVTCPYCGQQTKTRSFDSELEVQDLIAAVVLWLRDAKPVELKELFENCQKWFDDELLDEKE